MQIITAMLAAMLAWILWVGVAVAAFPRLNVFVIVLVGIVLSNGCALLALVRRPRALDKPVSARPPFLSRLATLTANRPASASPESPEPAGAHRR